MKAKKCDSLRGKKSEKEKLPCFRMKRENESPIELALRGK